MKLMKRVIKDSDHVKNLFVQVDVDKGSTSVLSNFSAWENLAYLMEALAATAEKCINDGISKKVVYDEIRRYIIKTLGDYRISK